MGVNAPARDATVNSSDIKVLCQGRSAFQSSHAGGALWDMLGFSKHPGPVLGLAQTVPHTPPPTPIPRSLEEHCSLPPGLKETKLVHGCMSRP